MFRWCFHCHRVKMWFRFYKRYFAGDAWSGVLERTNLCKVCAAGLVSHEKVTKAFNKYLYGKGD